MQVTALLLSGIAVLTSLITMWLTLFRRGSVKMTRPSSIYFGPDGGSPRDPRPKLYLRTLLFCTSKRGRVVETMFARLTRNESRQNLNIWVMGDDRLARGSGVFVGENGIVANHHFLTPEDGNSFRFQEGTYLVEVFAKLLDEPKHRLMFSHSLCVDSSQAKALLEPKTGLYFDWGPDAGTYLSHIRSNTGIEPSEVEDLFRTVQSAFRPGANLRPTSRPEASLGSNATDRPTS